MPTDCATLSRFMLMVQTSTKVLTLEEFLALPETKPASEYVDGHILPKPMLQGQHSRIQQKLSSAINSAINAATEDPQQALALTELRCTFGNRSIVPDIAVFQWERLPVNDDGTLANAFTASPDWIIEILSPDQSVTRVVSKILHCIDHGCQIGWLIDPSEQLVQVYDHDKRLTSLEEPSETLPVPPFASAVQLTIGQLFSWLQVR